MRARTFVLLLGLVGCSDGDEADGNARDDGGESRDAASAPESCEQGLVPSANGCVESYRRHEPKERIDFDNVAAYGNASLQLKLPPPPKSGFRLVVSPMELEAGSEVEECRAWEYPALTHRNVYAARLYTTGALHHSNVYGVPLASIGPSPYPGCAPGQGGVQGQTDNLLAGDILDVLFANSTQIPDGEQVVFPEGMAFKLKTEGREITASVHWLNTSDEPLTSEIVYDFFTMPDELVETEIVPFVFEPEEFSIAPGTTGDIVSTCDLAGDGEGHLVTLMPHTHKRTNKFSVELLDADGKSELIFEDGQFDSESDITIFEEPIALAGFSRIRHTCTVHNDLDKPIVWGLGDNEMCTLFGYLFPASVQQLGYTPKGGTECISLDLGSLRK